MITMMPAKVPAIIGTGESLCGESESVPDAADPDDDNDDMTGLVRVVDEAVLIGWGMSWDLMTS